MKYLVVTTLKWFFLFAGVGVLIATLYPIYYPRLRYQLDRLSGKQYELLKEENVAAESAFGKMLRGSVPLKIIPTNKDFSIVIEKININAPVVANVSVSNEADYKEALKHGVAHAKGSAAPGEGNTYLFAHSSLDFWELGKYATVFNLLDKLSVGDRIFVFYQGDRIEYKVTNTAVYKDRDTSVLYQETAVPTLFLQTCTPPGTTLNRLVVTAKIV